MANNDQLKQLLNMGLSALSGGDAQHEGGIADLIEHLAGSIEIPQQLVDTVEKLIGVGQQPAAQPAAQPVAQPAAQPAPGVVSSTLTQLSQQAGHTQEVAAQKAGEVHNSIMDTLTALTSAASKAEGDVQQHAEQAHSSIMDALSSLTAGAQKTEQDAHSSVLNALGSLDKDQLGNVLGKVTDLLGSLGK